MRPWNPAEARACLRLPLPSPSPGPSDGKPPAGDLGGLRRYSREQVSRILQRAVDLDREQGTGLGRATLLEIAREVGVAPDAIDAAVRELDRHKPPGTPGPRAEPSTALAAREIPLGLRRHIAVWGVFAVFFLLVNLFGGGGWWFYWPVLGWGLGLALHAVGVFTKPSPAAAKRRRDSAADIEAGAEALLDTARRVRVADARVRVDEVPRPDAKGPTSDADSSDSFEELIAESAPARKLRAER